MKYMAEAMYLGIIQETQQRRARIRKSPKCWESAGRPATREFTKCGNGPPNIGLKTAPGAKKKLVICRMFALFGGRAAPGITFCSHLEARNHVIPLCSIYYYIGNRRISPGIQVPFGACTKSRGVRGVFRCNPPW